MSHETVTFEKMEAWAKARRLTRSVYSLTRDGRIAKDFGVCRQVQRAAISVMSNIAEGYERFHVPEKLQFYNIARASAGEVRSLLYVVEDNYPEHAHTALSLRKEVDEVGRLVSGLIRSTQQRRGGVRLLVAIAILLVLAVA